MTQPPFGQIAVILIELACGVVICAGVVFIGYVIDRYTHAGATAGNPAIPSQGVWFCINGIFGNGC